MPKNNIGRIPTNQKGGHEMISFNFTLYMCLFKLLAHPFRSQT